MYVCARIKFSTWWPTLGENLFAENLHTGCFRDRDVRKYFPNFSAQELLDRRNNIEFTLRRSVSKSIDKNIDSLNVDTLKSRFPKTIKS